MTDNRQRITNIIALLSIVLWLAIIAGGVSGGGLPLWQVGVWLVIPIIGAVGYAAWGPGVERQ